jgi:bacterioferritin (cytochrome b1)
MKLEAALERLLKAIDNYQRHGEMMSDKYKNALLNAKIEAMEALA